ncbi:MAG: hypothetical protein ACREKL_14715 [Chthoniobacterales bacterium]
MEIAAADDIRNYPERLQRWEWLVQGITLANAPRIAETIRIGGGERAPRCLFIVLLAWARLDPKSAVEYARNLPADKPRTAIGGALTGWADTDYDAAARWANANLQGYAKINALRNMVGELPGTNPQRALEVCMDPDMDFEVVNGIVGTVFEDLARRDPALAAERVVDLPIAMLRGETIPVVADIWARKDRAAALAWIATLPVTRNPEEGFENTRVAAFAGVLDDWSRQDAPAALEWLSTMPAGTERDEVLKRNIDFVASDIDPSALLDMVELIGSKNVQENALQSVTRGWVKQDRDAAMEWAAAQTDPAIRTAAYRGLISGLASDDTETATRFALSLADRTQRDCALDDVAFARSSKNPAAAAAWADKLQSKDRSRALITIIYQWLQKDSTAARKWIADSTLPESEKRRLVDTPGFWH